jgi:hypothetical protein
VRAYREKQMRNTDYCQYFPCGGSPLGTWQGR